MSLWEEEKKFRREQDERDRADRNDRAKREDKRCTQLMDMSAMYMMHEKKE